jgi:hypothetical protein
LPPTSGRERLVLVIQVAASLTIVGAAFIYVLWSSNQSSSADDDKRPTPPEEVVQIAGPRLIRVRAGTPLDRKLQIVSIETAWLSAPVLPVTGTALASLRVRKDEAQGAFASRLVGSVIGHLADGPLAASASLVSDRPESMDAWQFATPDLLSAFTDWQKAVLDVQFQETQLRAIEDLNVSRVDAQKKVVARMEKLYAIGTDTEKDLAVERTNLLLAEIQGRKEIHEAETAVRVSRRAEAALARQLQQAGLEPRMLRSAAAEGEVVVAEVPERAVSRVRLDMKCDVRFYALPDHIYTGRVSAISPVISKDKRVLNVQFIVQDPDRAMKLEAKPVIRPGMFAEIGLGTDRRQALLMPADGILHVGENDYALEETREGTWQIVKVQIGEVRGAEVEVLSGLKQGDRVLGKGAILLKPVVVRALAAESPSTRPVSGAEKGE